MTQVMDAEGHRTDYHFDSNKRLQIVSTPTKLPSLPIRPYGVGSRQRQPFTQNHQRRSRHPSPHHRIRYDTNHNPIEEKIGIGKEWRTISSTYSEDGLNLKLSETDQEGKLTRYQYIPTTNLLTSELTYEKDHIRTRIFHTYDDCAVCTKTIIDDGNTEDPHNLSGVTYRKITEIIPKQTTPCFGLPEVLLEKTINASGQEILLKKVIYTYTPFGKVLKEDHYDANNHLPLLHPQHLR